MTEREANRTLALVAGLVALAGPRRTRPLAGFLYGVWLSRAQGSSLRSAQVAGQATMLRLFDEKQSVGARVKQLEAIVRAQYGGRTLQEIRDGVEASRNAKTDAARLPVFMGGI